MDILRRIFGVQVPPQEADSPAVKPAHAPLDLDGPTAPLPPKSFPNRVEQAVADEEVIDLGSTNIVEDSGRTQKLPDIDATLGGRNGRAWSYGQKTDVGQVRDNNQDAVLSIVTTISTAESQPEFGLFVVADGMGGHHDGEKASALAARAVTQFAISNLLMPMLRREEASADRPTVTETMRQAVQKANEEVSSVVPEGGTTLTVAAVIGDLAYIAHVGDSRAYIISREGVEQITRDHSLVQRLIELEQLTPAEAAEHPQRNVLYRALGQSDSVDVDSITRRLNPGVRLLLCSDGLWNFVSEDELRNTVVGAATPQSACETLIKLANSRGGPDNISVVLVKMPD